MGFVSSNITFQSYLRCKKNLFSIYVTIPNINSQHSVMAQAEDFYILSSHNGKCSKIDDYFQFYLLFILLDKVTWINMSSMFSGLSFYFSSPSNTSNLHCDCCWTDVFNRTMHYDSNISTWWQVINLEPITVYVYFMLFSLLLSAPCALLQTHQWLISYSHLLSKTQFDLL